MKKLQPGHIHYGFEPSPVKPMTMMPLLSTQGV